MALKLKEGKKYRLRCGLETPPIQKSNNGTSYKFEAFVKQPQYPTASIMSWLPNGMYFASGVETKNDIIEEL